MASNMANQLTPSQALERDAERYRKDQEKRVQEKAESKVMGLRALEFGTGAVIFTGLAALESYKPEWFAYEIPRIALTVLGIGAFMFAGKRDWIREVGQGAVTGGGFPLLGLGAKKGVEYLQAA